MRCLALAQAWQDAGGRVVLAWSEMPELLVDRLQSEGLHPTRVHATPGSPSDARQTQQLAHEAAAGWVVTDGYHFDDSYHQLLRMDGIRLMAIDDMAHLKNYPVDILLNQNLGATRERYADKVGFSTKLLLGPRFCLLRREFRVLQGWTRPHAREPLRLMVTFGGSDPENATGLVLQALARDRMDRIHVVVLVGSANQHVETLRQLAASSPFPCDIRVNVGNVAEVMAWADVAITAAGSTVWELATMKLPALVGALADNQIAGLEALRTIALFRVGLASELFTSNLTTAIRAHLHSLEGLDLNAPSVRNGVDANGGARVVDAVLQFFPLR